jgi:hypothetical protein
VFYAFFRLGQARDRRPASVHVRLFDCFRARARYDAEFATPLISSSPASKGRPAVRYWLLTALLGCLVIVGCNKPSSAPDSKAGNTTSDPDTSSANKAKKPKPTKPEETKLEAQANAVIVPKGKSAKSRIAVKRMGMFKGDVKLEFDTSSAPGITIKDVTIAADKEELEVDVTAAADAKGGRVTMIATGTGVDPFPSQFEVTVGK